VLTDPVSLIATTSEKIARYAPQYQEKCIFRAGAKAKNGNYKWLNRM
jgi:hypothetical protein